MTKPDDIPQDVWDAAFHCMDEHCPAVMLGDDHMESSVQSAIARAILAAKAEEREACALEMCRRERENANTPDTQAAYRNAASAIRSRT